MLVTQPPLIGMIGPVTTQTSGLAAWVDGQPILVAIDTAGVMSSWVDGQPQVQENVT